VQIRVLGGRERKRFDALMGEYHYLEEGHPAGDTMRMGAELDGQLGLAGVEVGLLSAEASG